MRFDTRAQGLAPTSFDPDELSTFTRQRQLDELAHSLRDRDLVPEPVLNVMFWPDHGRVPTERDEDQGQNVVFSGTDSEATWTVLVSGIGHLRVTRSTHFLS